ncbi:sorting nexin-1a isoform X2 [Myripristis murdjan]|uniref:sorting nexin-1a isoform X2 n=1 Tax=Myripristis murdjan TaxID=586833 RepID=UPI001176049B|nr:sorting nexin-1-like isoform X2 [Myripristis murdjan]
MATSSERSPPPFPDSEDQELLESEEVGAPDSDDDDEGEDLFINPEQLTKMDTTLPEIDQPSAISAEPPSEAMGDPLVEPVSHTEDKPASEAVSESLDDFVDLTNNETDAPGDAITAEIAITDATKETTEIALDEPSDDFVDLLGNETEVAREEVVTEDVTVEAVPDSSEAVGSITDPPSDDRTGSDAEQEVKEASSCPIIDTSIDSSASNTQQPPVSEKIADPLVDLISDAPPADVKKPSQPLTDLFEDEPSDLFREPQLTKSAKQPQKSLFDEPDEDIFGEPLGATSKKTLNVAGVEQKEKNVTTKSGGSDVSGIGGPLNDNFHPEPTDIFTEEAVTTVPSVVSTSSVTSKTNGVHSEEEADIFAEATVELSLDSPRNDRKKNVMTKPAASAPSLSVAASLSKPQSATLEELEEEEQEDKFDINISITNPEKIGDGMNAYMAYKVSTQTTLPMFRSKAFTVRRRFSDFLGLYEKLSEKHGPNGYIVPPPPEKSILGMTKVKVGKEDPSSAEFVERRRAALERYLQRVVCHPSLLQDPDVREFLERDELPRAVNTQALSGAGFLKMINKATDAVSKMTIKMNESDVWFEEKLQEVESADQQFRKIHGLVDSLVGHRKELSLNTAGFAKSVAMLGSSEDNTALSRALSQLAEVEDKMEQLHQEQASNDSFCFAELLADYIRLLGAVRGSFDQRMKAWQRWQDAQSMLQKKRETEAKLLWANKPDKLQLAKDEITEWEAKVTQYERDFDRVSATVRKEVLRFEKEKARDFKKQIIKYLESMLQSQQQLIKYWEAFLPEAKAIA